MKTSPTFKKLLKKDHLAQMANSLCAVHAANPELVYQGAKKKGLSERDLAKLAHDDPIGFGNLMFD